MIMKLDKIMMTAVLAAACVAALVAAPQSDKQPVVSSTGRFGDPSTVAIKYRDYLFGIVKEVNANEVILSKTKFGVDQPFKFTKKTKFFQDGKPSSFDKIKVGEGVYIDVDTDKKTGDQLAKKVVSGVDMPKLPSEK
jgi:hypothetical protein